MSEKVAENSEFYTDEETNSAIDFIKTHKLPMSELRFALKYMRILNRAANTSEQLSEVTAPADMLEDDPIGYVSPPEYSWNNKENQPLHKDD